MDLAHLYLCLIFDPISELSIFFDENFKFSDFYYFYLKVAYKCYLKWCGMSPNSNSLQSCQAFCEKSAKISQTVGFFTVGLHIHLPFHPYTPSSIYIQNRPIHPYTPAWCIWCIIITVSFFNPILYLTVVYTLIH